MKHPLNYCCSYLSYFCVSGNGSISSGCQPHNGNQIFTMSNNSSSIYDNNTINLR